jgi:ketosteroid isomerase-like protein
MSTLTLTDNASTIASVYEAFGRADISFILGHVANNCKWTGAGEGFLPQGGTYTGQQVADFFKALNDGLEFNAFNPVAIYNIGQNEVAAYGNMTTTSRHTGKNYSSDWAMHWKFDEEGKIIYYQDFHNTAGAYAANQPD